MNNIGEEKELSTCSAVGCNSEVQETQQFCKRHFSMVPYKLRQAMRNSRFAPVPVDQKIAAVRTAAALILRLENRDREPMVEVAISPDRKIETPQIDVIVRSLKR